MKVFYLIIKSQVRILLLVILFNNKVFAQVNLVPNSGFENYDTCPIQYGGIYTGVDQICRAIPWFQPHYPNPSWCGGSSDFYHSCAGSVPTNFAGKQSPHYGNGYTGISPYQFSTSTSDLWREHIEVPLTSPLGLNKNYCVSWYTSLAEMSRYGCNRIGAYFSTDTLFQSGPQLDYIPVVPQVENLEIVTDTANWVLFKQILTAQGGEKFMTVGNFRSGIMTDTSFVINQNGWAAYYYFDDFGVYELPELDAGNNDSICTTGGSVQLNANCTGCWPGLQYRWWPATGLNDTTILNPIASPTQTTTYYVGLIDTSNTVPCIIDLTDSLTVYVCDSIAKPPSDTVFTFNLYPNPTFGELSLAFTGLSEDVILYIYDARGRMAARYAIPKGTVQKKIDITPLSKAVYILKLQGNSIKEMRKLVKN